MLSIFRKVSNSISSRVIRKTVNQHFDSRYYIEKYQIADADPLSHFLSKGHKQGFDPCEWFSTQGYLNAYPDVASLGLNPFFHYLAHGKEEGRHTGYNDNTKVPKLKQFVTGEVESDPDYENSSYYLQGNWILDIQDSLNHKQLKKFRDWVNTVPEAKGDHPSVKAYLDDGAAVEGCSNGLVCGWVLRKQNSIIWYQTSCGGIFPSNTTYHYYRDDVIKAFFNHMKDTEPRTGIVKYIEQCKPNSYIKMFALSSKGAHQISTIMLKELEPTPVAIAKYLASLETPIESLVSRISNVDEPLLSKAINRQTKITSSFPTQIRSYGETNEPKVSIIIPLYGRCDFVEAQMQCFVNDKFIMENCEIIYVIDDPLLVEPMRTQSLDIYALYGVPFKTIWGFANRGFSGANNLGAKNASASHFLFMNSDVFPINTGWVEKLLCTLEENETIGVVSPRLLFADGSIQHAGMEFMFNQKLLIWTNHHPKMGIEPNLDPVQSPLEVPALTGACMLIEKDLFNLIGGWDPSYLIGDFEDSDLCLKVQEANRKCVYDPSVELTHLERQSFTLNETDNFRNKVVFFNATRHHNKWSDRLNSLYSKNSKERCSNVKR